MRWSNATISRGSKEARTPADGIPTITAAPPIPSIAMHCSVSTLPPIASKA